MSQSAVCVALPCVCNGVTLLCSLHDGCLLVPCPTVFDEACIWKQAHIVIG